MASTTSSGGVGFLGLLTILFITLKLTGVITWSWWWVLSPIWLSVLLAAVVIGVILLLVWWLRCRARRRNRARFGG